MPYTPIDDTNSDWPTYGQQRGRFAGASEALNPSEPQQPQTPTTELRQWQIGDLITNKYTGVDALITGVWRKSLDIIDSSGSARPMGREAANTEWNFRQSSSLSYESDTMQRAELDFAAGLFTPYFKLLS